MSLRSRFRSWRTAIRQRSAMEADMSAELTSHIEAYAADLRKSGLTEDQALRKARLAFGSVEAVKQDVRQSRGLRFWDDLAADLRYAFRGFHNSPGFALIAVISLALGIGANTTIFTLANSVLLDKLAVPHPDTLRLLSWSQDNDRGLVHDMWGSDRSTEDHRFASTSFSYPVYRLLRSKCADVAALFAFKPLGGMQRFTATMDASSEIVTGELASGNYFSVLGLKPQAGRLITNADDGEPGSGPVAVLSDRYWAARFGRSRSVVGKQIALNHLPITIVGVAPRGFTGANSVQIAPDLFLPLSMQPALVPMSMGAGPGSLLDNPNLWWVLVMGRIKPGISQDRAQTVIRLRLQEAVRSTMSITAGADLPKASLDAGNRGQNNAAVDHGQSIRILMGLVAFVLLLACVNIANLMLARSTVREREISVRLALGAARWRIVKQALTESFLLSALGGFAGLLLAYLSRNFLPHFLSNAWDTTRLEAHVDWRVLLFTAGVSAAAGLLFGLAPAWRAARHDLYTGVKDRGLRTSGGRKSRAGQLLVIAQIALSMLLVTTAGLFLRTVLNLAKVDVGFETANLVVFELQPPDTRYPGKKAALLLHQVEERLQNLPGVEAVAMSSEPLIANSMSNAGFTRVGQTYRGGADQSAHINDVNSSFFSTLRIPLIAGRAFNQADAASPNPVVILNQKAAHQFFGKANPLGQQLESHLEQTVRTTIVGLCNDAKYEDLRHEAPPTVYLDYRQSPDLRQITFEVRSREPRFQLAPSLRAAVQTIDRELPLVDLRTEREQIEATTVEQRLFASVATGFGILALAIASVGIYGLMAFSVASRRNEIGIRMALGAQARQVLGMVLTETAILGALGVAVGTASSVASARLLSSTLFGLQPNDPATIAASVGILLVTALAAGFVPARRAATVDPLEAVRHE